MIDVQDEIDALGMEVRVKEPIDINNRGQVLLQTIRDDGSTGLAILSPVAGESH